MISFDFIAQTNLPALHVPRPRLVERLLEKKQRLLLLCAPAGYGKSTLLQESFRQSSHAYRHAWVFLDGQDLSLERFCQRTALALGIPAGQSHDEHAVLNWLREYPDPLRLMIDDYPGEANEALDRWIDLLLKECASEVQLVVTCRQRPRWNLTRLVLDDDLLELDCGQLAFNREEHAAMVTLVLPSLGYKDSEDLWQQTLGWCAGLRLLLNGRQQPSQAGDTSRWLQDYLKHELLSHLTIQECSLLCAIAHLPRFNAELCAHLWEDDLGGELFERLSGGNSFFVAVGPTGQWYRLLPAVAKALRSRLQGTELTRVRLRACHWLNVAGLVDDAVEFAICSGQPDLAADFMNSLGFDWLFANQHLDKLLGWHQRIPKNLLLSTPRLIFQTARALLLSWRLDEAQACIARLDRFLPQSDAQNNRRILSNWLALQGSLEGLRGNSQLALQYCQQALACLGHKDWRSSILCYSTLARVAMANGQSREARQLLLDAVQSARRHGCLASEILINTDRIRQAILSQDLVQAQALLQQSQELIQGAAPSSFLSGRLQLLQGELLLLGGATDEAEQAFQRGVDLASECCDPFMLHGYIGLSEMAARRGLFEQANRYLHDAERCMHCNNAQASCYQMLLDLQRSRLFARQGDWLNVLPISRAIEHSVQCQHARIVPLNAPSLAHRNQLLLALAELGLDQTAQARSRLTTLLEQCQRLGFTALASEAHTLLEKISQPRGDTWPQVSPTTGVSAQRHALSDRELSVLTLLAEGLTNQEIGNNLFISLNTVKAHAKKINVKLGVKRRTQAVQRAREVGALSS